MSHLASFKFKSHILCPICVKLSVFGLDRFGTSEFLPLSDPLLKAGFGAGLDNLVDVRLVRVERAAALEAAVADVADERPLPRVLELVRRQRLLALDLLLAVSALQVRLLVDPARHTFRRFRALHLYSELKIEGHCDDICFLFCSSATGCLTRLA